MDAMKDQANHVVINKLPRDWTRLTNWLTHPAAVMAGEVLSAIVILAAFIFFALIPV